MSKLSVRHVDTCLPCYVQDHCNREGEMLLGVPVDKASRIHHVRSALADECRAYGEKLPESISEDDVAAAIAECFTGVHPLKSFDSTLERVTDEHDEPPYAWFRFSWEVA